MTLSIPSGSLLRRKEKKRCYLFVLQIQQLSFWLLPDQDAYVSPPVFPEANKKISFFFPPWRTHTEETNSKDVVGKHRDGEVKKETGGKRLDLKCVYSPFSPIPFGIASHNDQQQDYLML